MLDQVAVRQRARQHAAVGTHVRRIALALERRRVDATVGRLVVRAAVIRERAHVQDIVFIARSEARAQPLVDGLRVADVTKHRLKRYAGLAQRLRRRHERRLVEGDAHHQQRALLEVLAAQCAVAHVLVQPQQKPVIAAPRHDRWLLIEGQLVKRVVHVYAHHIVEELVVHEARADHIHRAVDVRLVPLAVVREHLCHVAKQHRLELPQHRPVRERHAERARPLHHEATALRQLQPVSAPGDAHAAPPERCRQQLQRRVVEALQVHATAWRGLHMVHEQLHQQRRQHRTRQHRAQRGRCRVVRGKLSPALVGQSQLRCKPRYHPWSVRVHRLAQRSECRAARRRQRRRRCRVRSHIAERHPAQSSQRAQCHLQMARVRPGRRHECIEGVGYRQYLERAPARPQRGRRHVAVGPQLVLGEDGCICSLLTPAPPQTLYLWQPAYVICMGLSWGGACTLCTPAPPAGTALPLPSESPRCRRLQRLRRRRHCHLRPPPPSAPSLPPSGLIE
eukprot:scaffold10993_cov75-Phaeocystis_antarctica.AAC.4